MYKRQTLHLPLKLSCLMNDLNNCEEIKHFVIAIVVSCLSLYLYAENSEFLLQPHLRGTNNHIFSHISRFAGISSSMSNFKDPLISVHGNMLSGWLGLARN